MTFVHLPFSFNFGSLTCLASHFLLKGTICFAIRMVLSRVELFDYGLQVVNTFVCRDHSSGICYYTLTSHLFATCFASMVFFHSLLLQDKFNNTLSGRTRTEIFH